MATTRLTAGSQARCAIGMLTIAWKVIKADAAVELIAIASGAPAAAVSAPGPSQLLLAALPEAVVLSARPADGGTFPNGAKIATQLSLAVGNKTVSQFRLSEADVSGTSRTELVRITPMPDFWQLDVPEDTPPPPPPPPGTARTPKEASEDDGQPAEGGTPLIQGSAYAARRRAGAARLPEAARTELHVAVDRSASLLPLTHGGSGQALLEFLIGVNDVVGRDSKVGLWTVADVPTRLRPELDRSNVSGRWEAEFARTAQTGGTLVSPLVPAVAGKDGVSRTVVVVTDSVPADLDDIERSLTDARSRGDDTRWHFLLLARSYGDPDVQAQPWRDEAVALRRAASNGLVTYSAVTPGQSDGWLRELLDDESGLQSVLDPLPFWPVR